MTKYNYTISSEENLLINYLFYKYHSLLNILRYLLQQDIKKEYIQEYTLETEKAFTELEMAKRNIVNIYEPNELKNKAYTFTFDFDNCQLIFEEQNNE